MGRAAKLILLAFVFVCIGYSFAQPSPYVSNDSWIYPVIDRMIARGDLEADGIGVRPWTRSQVASLLKRCRNCESPEVARLREEFPDDSPSVFRVDELYLRSSQIFGTPLTNGFDYGQTVVNDFGRPNREGQNFIAGVQMHAVSRYLVGSARVEFQRAPFDNTVNRTLIASLDGPAAAAHISPNAIHRLRILEGYVGTRLGNLDISVGEQQLRWGSGYSGSMLMGEIAEPIPMLRMRNAESIRMPWIFSHMGRWRGEFFVGKLGGHVQPFSPWLQGQKITVTITPNLEFGFSRTIVFAGGGREWLKSFGRSFWSVGNNLSNTPGTATDVGDRRGGFEFQYRLPKLRNYATLYVDSFTDDDPSPLSAPRRAAVLSGLYLPRLPGVSRMDLRLESAYTDAPGVHGDGRFFYVNGGYVQSYSSNGELLGHWVGRAGKAYQGWATYWFSTTTKAQFSVRTLQSSPKYLPGGGRQWDVIGTFEKRPRANLALRLQLQFEKWQIPALDSHVHNNVCASFQMSYRPAWFTSAN